ncbi:MAG TPA: DUF222 domain-containing protein, partial [Nocardioidaceae bacterium]|nr:DUF222 domain-containing protein [Nocardioidaceae bacterium]
ASALRAFEAEGGLAGSGCKTTGSWARLHLRRDHGAHRIVRRTRLLPQLPGFAAAFAAGQVTDEHVDTLLRWTKPCGMETLQTHEQTLLDLACAGSPRELAQALEVLADLVDPDRDEDKIQALADRSFKASAVGDLVHVDAMVEPALGEALKTAVEANSARRKGPDAVDDGRTLMQRRADAFAEILLAGIGAGTTGRPHTGRLRPQIAVTVTLDQLQGIAGAPKALLDHFGVIPTATVRRLACDADLTRVILDTATGKPLNVGRRHRLAVKRQRRALATLFRHCAFPGCTVPFRFTEIHHRDWWCRDHGATNLDLLLPYCWTHHHFLHEHGFTVTTEHLDGTDHLVHHRPDGTTLPDPDQALHHTVKQLHLDHPHATADDPDPPTGSRHPPTAA